MQHKRHLLVASDIFGATPALRETLATLPDILRGQLQLTLCQPDSCMKTTTVFTDDQLAYQAFLQQGGLERYQQQVLQTLTAVQPDLVLGFSAGAAALWWALSRADCAGSSGQALLCYGGQIRQYYDLTPHWPVTCLWSDENHFDVVALQQQLGQSGNVRQQHWSQRHGFINPHSTGYDASAADLFWQRCQQWIQNGDF
jgi:dienelactone hydrolase